MQPTDENQPPTTNTGKVGMYWRKGSSPMPGIMTLDGRNLRFKTTSEELFNTDIGDVTATFTIYGTLVLAVRSTGKTYKFVMGAAAGPNAKRFTREQIAEVAGNTGEQQNDLSNTGLNIHIGSNVIGSISKIGGSVLGEALGATGELVGVFPMFKAQRISFYAAHQWALYLQAQGVAVHIKTHKYMTSQIVVACMIVGALLTMIILVIALVPSK